MSRSGGLGGTEEELLGPAYNPRVLSRLWEYLRPYKGPMALAVAAVVLYSGTVVAAPYLIKLGIDEFIITGDIAGLNVLALVFLANAVLAWFLQWGQQIILARVGQGILYKLRNALFGHIQRLSLSFIDKRQIGRIISRVQSDIGQLQELITGGLLTSIGDAISLIGIVIIMMTMNWQLALATFTVLPLAFLLIRIWQPRAVGSFRLVRRAISEVNSGLQEDIAGIRAVQALSREEENARRFDSVNVSNMEANLRAGRLSAAVVPAVEFLTALAIGIAVVVGGMLVFDQRLTAGELVAFALYIQRFFDPIRELSLRYTQLQAAMTSGERIFELLDVEPEISDAPNALDLPEVKGHVEFDNVWFEYVEGQPVLKGVSLNVQRGETIALVGPTGAGKSTFVNLIPRFYDIKSGAIRIDGHDIREVTQASLRRNIAVVLQEPVLFTGTLRSNLLFGNADATDEQLWEALNAVGVGEMVSKSARGLETEMGERGLNLSLGQRQLVSFARALIADPRIIILDEATASIDTHTERLVKEAISRLLSGRTAFVIAHRLATIRDASRIAVIKGGQIVELGTHDELMALRGEYFDLYSMAARTISGTTISEDGEIAKVRFAPRTS